MLFCDILAMPYLDLIYEINKQTINQDKGGSGGSGLRILGVDRVESMLPSNIRNGEGKKSQIPNVGPYDSNELLKVNVLLKSVISMRKAKKKSQKRKSQKN